MASKKSDQYVNQLNISLELSAANTLTFEEIDIGVSLFDKIGMLVQRLEYTPDHASLADMLVSTAKIIQLGLSTSNQISDIELDQTPVVDKLELDPVLGTNGAHMHVMPYVRNFTGLSGNGLILTPRPLYFAGNSSGLTVTMTAQLRIYFTLIQLSDADYFELLESRRFLG